MKVFKCPSCGRDKIECVQESCIISQQVTVDDDGTVDYVERTLEILDSHIDRFQCEHCGWKIPCGSEEDDLVAWLDEQK